MRDGSGMPWTRHTCALLPGFMALLWLAMFAFSRVFMFYSEYQAEEARRADDEWLRVRCKDPEFFHNMKQHTDLCLKVEQNARRSSMLVALNNVFTSTYLCGYSSCADYLTSAVMWCMGLSLPALVISGLALLFVPTLIYPLYAAQLNRMADRRVMSLYNAPYGLHHYAASHQPLSYPAIVEVGEAGMDLKKIA
eukprot:765856-Hanusia_phi.AAC.1